MSALDVARYLVNLSTPHTSENVTNLKIQKLLYYCQGFCLAIHETELFNDDIEAWTHGPVVRSVYSEFKSYSYQDIDIKFEEKLIELTPLQKRLIDDVWEIFKNYNGKELEELTHSEDPWIETRGNLSEFAASNRVINNDLIQKYFEEEYILS